MSTQTTAQSVLFPALFTKPLLAQFDQPHASSDGGAILLKAADKQLDLIDCIISLFDDRRQSAKIRHTLAELL